MFENSEIELITSLDRKVNSELIPINIKRKMDDTAWTTGDVPQTVELQIGYYLKTKNTKVILVGDLVLSDFQQGTEFNQTTYDFVFKFYPLS